MGVLIVRLPAGRSVVWARSECGGCHRVLHPIDLVPILSFLLLRGRCRTCGSPIAPLHLWVELAAILVAVWAVLAAPDTPTAWLDCVLGWTLLTLGWIDARHFLLPDVLTLPLVLAGLAGALWLTPDHATDAAAAAALGYLGFRAVEVGYRTLRGRDGLGQGDAKLAAAAGAWAGLEGIGETILLAAVLGLVYGAARQIWRRGARSVSLLDDAPIPFGPFLAAALWVVRTVF